MHLIIGLGNPGSAYRNTRHNVGFMVVDRLARECGARWEQVVPLALTGRCGWRGKPLLLAKPVTFMNRSGAALRALLLQHPLPLESLLVVYDDFSLPLGKIRLRARGSAGGHKGMESIIAVLETEEIPRLRVGIGREEGPEDPTAFVLGEFTREERSRLESVLDWTAEAVWCWLSEGIEKAMSRFNSRAS